MRLIATSILMLSSIVGVNAEAPGASTSNPSVVQANSSGTSAAHMNRCNMLVPKIVKEKELLDKYLYDRIVRTSDKSDPSVVCTLYAIWDQALNITAAEVDRCFDTTEAEGIYQESRNLGWDMSRLKCSLPAEPSPPMNK